LQHLPVNAGTPFDVRRIYAHQWVKECIFGSMEVQKNRRRRLQIWIALHHEGILLRFAKLVGKSNSQLQDVLRGRKSFGEKLARSLERAAKMPAGWLDESPQREGDLDVAVSGNGSVGGGDQNRLELAGSE
jgi:hypothetical protein